MQVSLKTDIRKATRDLNHIEKRQIPFATKNAINKTLFDLRMEMQRQSEIKIDRPTSFTKRGYYVNKVKNKRQLTGNLHFNRDYAQILVEGGRQNPRSGNRVLITPTGNARKNRFGNVTKATQKKYITDKKRYFFGIPKGKAGEQYAGIWERTNRNNKIKQVAAFEPTRLRPKTFPFYKIASGKAQAVFPRHFNEQLANALKTAR